MNDERGSRWRGWRSWRPGLRARTTLALALFALVGSAGLAFFSYELTRSRLLDDREDAATTQAFSNARAALATLREPDADVGRLLDSIQRRSGSVVLIHDDGRWFAGAVGFEPTTLPRSLRQIVFDEEAAAGQRIRVDDVPYEAVGTPLVAVGARYFELVPMDQLEETLSEMARVLILGAATSTIIGGVVGLWLSGRVLRPLRRVAVTAGGIAGGSVGDRLQADNDPDLRPLVEAFNDMVEALEERIAREAHFASEVSHDLRAPIAAMASSLSVARRHTDDPEQVGEVLAELDQRIREFHQFVEDLLEMTRLESGTAAVEPIPRETGQLVRAAVEERGYDVPVHVDADVPRVLRSDPRRIGQVLANLLENAERYAGGATAVRVSAPVPERVRIAVEDEGPGVPADERAHIFERFGRGAVGRNAGAGTGLGLALVAQHARVLGGRVWVDDRPGGGSRFVVEVPVDVS